jgi:hypothetical protein
MPYACIADREDDYLVHRDGCAYVSAPEDQRKCRAEARSERQEKSALEATQDWHAQLGETGEARGIGEAGDTVYCGENTFEVEDDLIDSTDGSSGHNTHRPNVTQ